MKLDEKAVRQALVCPYCGSGTHLIDSQIVYRGRGFGWLWACNRYPECDAFVGCHPNSEKPLGRLADKKLRAAKMAAHAAFDPLWKWKSRRDRVGTQEARRKAYAWLSGQLGVANELCHIGMFDVDTCAKVTELCKKYRAGPKPLTIN